jgi:hypothetical protein
LLPPFYGIEMGDRSKFIKFYESEGLAAISRALRAQAAEAKAAAASDSAVEHADTKVSFHLWHTLVHHRSVNGCSAMC